MKPSINSRVLTRPHAFRQRPRFPRTLNLSISNPQLTNSNSDAEVIAIATNRPRRTSGPVPFDFKGTACDEPVSEMRPRLTPASRLRFRDVGGENFGVEAGPMASLSKLPIDIVVFAVEGNSASKGISRRRRECNFGFISLTSMPDYGHVGGGLDANRSRKVRGRWGERALITMEPRSCAA